MDTRSEIRDDGRLDEEYIQLLKTMKDPQFERDVSACLTKASVYIGIE
jgi:hypothetical protein